MIKLVGIGLLAFIILLLEQRIYRKLWSRRLKVFVGFKKQSIFEGEESGLIEIVENHKRLPLSMLKVKFQTDRNLLFEISEGSQTTDKYYRNDVFQIGGGEKITRTLVFKGGKRGFYRIDTVDLVAADLFLTTQMVDTLSIDAASLYVYPKPFDSEEFRESLKQLNGEILTKRHLIEDPFEYRGIREYQPFDDMRSINWKATAKTGDLKVNQKNYTALQSVRIFLNLEDNGVLKKQECVEVAIRIAAGICETFLREGMQVSCFCNCPEKDGGECLAIESSSGSGQMSAIYRGLSVLDESKTLPFAESFDRELASEERGIFTCFVSPNAYDDWLEIIEEYQDKGMDYIWFYPISGAEKPEIGEKLEKHVRFLSIS